jgi:hypothetical protein
VGPRAGLYLVEDGKSSTAGNGVLYFYCFNYEYKFEISGHPCYNRFPPPRSELHGPLTIHAPQTFDVSQRLCLNACS